MKQPLISILIPIYNAEQYLQRCLDSIECQSFDDYEVIMVNDGSTDDSLNICRKYASKDNKFIVVSTNNGGIASARLCSYEAARGKYLVFLDADDYLLPNSLVTLYTEIEKGFDIVRTPVLRENCTGKQWIDHYPIEDGVIEGYEEYIRSIILDKTASYLHCAIYRADLFNKNIFLVSASHKINVGEDWIVNYLISKKVRNVKFISSPTHVYCVNSNSTMKTYIRGWEFQYKIKAALAEFNDSLEPQIKELLFYNGIINKLRFFFTPEINFNWAEYKNIELHIDQAISMLKNEKYIPNSYLYFIHKPVLYYFYTRMYCLYYFVRYRKFKKYRILR